MITPFQNLNIGNEVRNIVKFGISTHGCTYALILTVTSKTLFYSILSLQFSNESLLHFQENVIPPNASSNILRERIRELRRTISDQDRTISDQDQTITRRATHINDLLDDIHDLAQAYRLLSDRCEQIERKLNVYMKLFCKSSSLSIVLIK